MLEKRNNCIVKLTESEIKRLKAVRTLADLVRKYAEHMINNK